jgi:hypothetical protein
VISDAEDRATCAVCHRPVAEVNGGADRLHLEVARGDLPEGPEYVDADMCTEAHAAEWLSEPSPTPAPPVPVQTGARDRLLGCVLALCALWSVALMVRGAYGLVRLLGGWD